MFADWFTDPPRVDEIDGDPTEERDPARIPEDE